MGKTKPNWLNAMITLVKSSIKDNKDQIKRLAKLFSIYDLYNQYNPTFKAVFSRECERSGMSMSQFLALMDVHQDEYNSFKKATFKINHDKIDKNKKIHFWMNSGTIKISTIHSFKGWESKVVFLILERTNDTQSSFDELLYTGITRCCSNLVVINYGNKLYDSKIKPLIENLK